MKAWDVFISHAGEDKETVAIPLAERLQRSGLRVWLDCLELKVGDSLRGKIDEGLAQSRFGIVILSPAFLGKRWPTLELNGLAAVEDDGRNVILPVWHGINKAELNSYSPTLSDRVASNTGLGLTKVASQIVEAVLTPGRDAGSDSVPGTSRLLAQLLDNNPPPERIADFLLCHQSMIYRPASVIENPGCLDKSIPFVSVSRGTTVTVTLMTFGEVTGEISGSLGRPASDLRRCGKVLSSAVKWAYKDREQAAIKILGRACAPDHTRFRGMLFARRREALAQNDVEMLERKLWRTNTNELCLRSYDLLIEWSARQT